ncbi:MAG: anti-sigma regulatory factor [Sulfurifustaceae bacterium]
MPVTRSDTFAVRSERDVVMVRQAVRRLAEEQRFSLVDQTKLVTAASEIARNTVVYGGGGSVRLEALADGARAGLRLVFEDEGPGIEDIELALRDGYTTGTGLGLGLGGAKRLCNEFRIDSKPGAGTRVTMVRWK